MNLPVLSAVYGLTTAAAAVFYNSEYTSLDGGWFCISLGRDKQKNVILFVTTRKNSFYLGASPIPAGPSRKSRIQWVFDIDELPSDMCYGASQRHELKHDGYFIACGRDSDNREFLSVKMSDRKRHLLFRNPDSHPVVALKPCRADAVVETPQTPPPAIAAAKNTPCPDVGSGDAELDDLLASLG